LNYLQGSYIRPRVAIISTYNELCGIAGYTRAIKNQISEFADVTVFDLDQYLLRSTRKPIMKLAEAHISDIASKLSDFDAVNIQLEHGTIGKTPLIILRRLARLIDASPRLCITFHTILDADNAFSGSLWGQISRAKIQGAINTVGSEIRARVLGGGVYKNIRKAQRKKPVSVIVHTKRDMRLLRDVYRLKNVEHHPLSYLDADSVASVQSKAMSRDLFPLLRNIPQGAKFVGTFGFLSPYKGFDTAIKAMYHLPDNYHLLVFGGVHPQSIKRHIPIDSYVDSLITEAKIGVSVAESLRDIGGKISTSGDPLSLIGKHPDSLAGRVHFMGALSDEDFATAMAFCDTVALPYLEVGQSSSGPIAIAMEVGARILASRNLAFMQYEMYHRGEIEFFDIGNFIHLAELIAAPAEKRQRVLKYNTETNKALYAQALGIQWSGNIASNIQPLQTHVG
jgi:glycosyltransferase involved in cell wall biosynthesis